MATRRARWLWRGGGMLVIVATVVAASLLLANRPAALPRDGSTADPATSDPTVDHLSIRLHAPGPAVTAQSAYTSGLISMPWVLFRQRDGGRTLQIVAATGDSSCVKPAGYRVEQKNSYVELWVYSSKAPSGTRCVDLVTEWRTDIRLDAPLGGRTLLHPRTDPAWPASRVFDGYTWATSARPPRQ